MNLELWREIQTIFKGKMEEKGVKGMTEKESPKPRKKTKKKRAIHSFIDLSNKYLGLYSISDILPRAGNGAVNKVMDTLTS